MDLKVKYQELLNLVESHIDCLFCQEQPSNLYEPIKYFMEQKGKRIRPILTIVATAMIGGDIYKSIKPAISLEFLHNFTLIHDDIMDNSPIRRGRPTVHVKYDLSTAILSGDLLLSIAFRKIIEDVGLDYCKEVLLTFTDALIEVCEGQGYDINFEKKYDITISDYLLMIEKKTAKLIENALLIGAYLANANKQQIEDFITIGRSIGIGFQLQDDLLDLTAENMKFGKEIGKDIQEGKKTYLILKSKELFKSTESINLLNKFYQNNGLHNEEVNLLINYMKEFGVIDATKEKINTYFEKAKEAVSKFEQNEYTQLMNYIIDMIFQRDF
ncbi:MAG: polyprenyl synthetase family protein [Candidatus Kapaibacteriota bacterium]